MGDHSDTHALPDGDDHETSQPGDATGDRIMRDYTARTFDRDELTQRHSL